MLKEVSESFPQLYQMICCTEGRKGSSNSTGVRQSGSVVIRSKTGGV